MARITVRIDDPIEGRLLEYTERTGRTTSETIRIALDAYLKSPALESESFYDAAKRLGAIGCAKGLPRDLSTNRRHLEGFGK